MRLCEEIGMEKLGNPVVVDIQNVQNYMHLQDKPLWYPSIDFPTWLCPWPEAFYEWSVDWQRWGVFVATRKDDEDGFDMLAFIFLSPDRMPAARMASFESKLGPAGNASGPSTIGLIDRTIEWIGDVDTATDIFRSAMFPVLLANSFLACKNVTTHDVQPHPKLAKAQMKKHAVPKITYKVLDIGPAKEVLRTEGDVEHNGLQKALHICRGHFAHYGPEAPLFGKYTGAFWHPMHMRGSAKNGIVVKDYRVKAEEPCTTTTNAKTVATGPALTT